MKQIEYTTYEARFSDIGLDTVYTFCVDGFWVAYEYTYEEAVKAYPLDEYEWLEISDDY